MTEYVFIHSHEATVPSAGQDRITIRRHVMRNAAQKQRGIVARNYGQLPVFLNQYHDENTHCSFKSSHDTHHGKRRESCIPRPLRAHNQSPNRLALLSPLTTLHINRTTAACLPRFLLPLITDGPSNNAKWSYTILLPRLYGRRRYLDSAIDCLDAKMEEVLSWNQHASNSSRRLYLKAIHNLRRSLDDKNECNSAEMLCASELLALWEVSTELIATVETLANIHA